MLLGVVTANAATTAGTDVTNNATLSYTVGTNTRTEASNDDVFKVDKKIDVIVQNAATAATEVSPGDSQAVLTFNVRNDTNAAQSFTLASVMNRTGDQFDPSACKTFLGGTDVTAGTTIPQESNISVEVRCDIPAAGVVNGNLGDIVLMADSGASATAGADNQNVVDIVLADLFGDAPDIDGNYDGKYGAKGEYIIKAAVLALKKLSCVKTDPVNGAVTDAKRIPGATLVYVFDIENSGSGNATALNIADTLSAELDGATVANINLQSNVGDTACNCTPGAGNTVTGTASTPTNTGAGQNVAITSGDINAPVAPATKNHSCLSFEVNII